MRKTHIHIGRQKHHNLEREARFVYVNGGTDVPGGLAESREPSAEEKRQALLMVLGILKQALDDPSLSGEVRPALEDLLSQARRSRPDQAANSPAYRATVNTKEGQQYAGHVAHRMATEVRNRYGYHSVADRGSFEGRADLLGTQDATHRLGEHARRRRELPESGDIDALFAVVEETYRDMTDKEAQAREIRARREQERICWQKRFICPPGYTMSYGRRMYVARARADFMKAIYPQIEALGLKEARADYKRLSDEFYRRTGVRAVEYRREKERSSRAPSVVVHAPDGRIVGSINPETGDGAWSPLVTKDQMLQWAGASSGGMDGNVRHVTAYPGDAFMDTLSPVEQADVFQNGRRAGPYINTFRANKALQNTAWKREFASPKTSQDFAQGYYTVNGERHPLYPASASGGSKYPLDYSDHPGYDYRRDPRFSQSTIDHINRQGGDRYMQTQLRLGRMYGDEIAQNLNAGKWADLAEDPRFAQKYQSIQNVLRRRSRHMWPRQPDQRYGDLAWARSQFEAMRKSQRQLDAMREAVPGEAIKVLKFPIRGEVRDADVGIVVPKEYHLEGEDGIIGIHDPRAWAEGPFGHSRGETYAHDAGIRVEKILNADGSVRGMQVEFTKPGVFYVNGRRIAVGNEGEEEAESHDIETIRRGAKGYVETSFGSRRPRELWITKDNGQPFTVDPTPATATEPIFVGEGIVIVRKPGPNYDYAVLFTKPGYYEVRGVLRDGYYNGHSAFPAKKINILER